jgi:hypothetical protein
MFDVKISAIAAGAAFVFSFLLGLLNGASLPFLVVRPLLFGVLFFVIAAFVYFLVSHFLPELLDGDLSESPEAGDALSPPGSRINIAEEEPAGMSFYSTQAAQAAQADDSEDDLGDISDLLKKGRTAGPAPRPAGTGFSGLDQSGEDGYTRSEAVPAGVRNNGGFTGNAVPKTVTVPDSAESVDTLPDLDAMARAFLPGSGEDEADAAEYSTFDDSSKRPAAGSRGQKMEGDFNPKELAAGIRTILKKEG